MRWERRCALTGRSTRTPNGGPSLRSGPFRPSPVNSDVRPHMLTLREVLSDAADLDEFAGVAPVEVNTRGISGLTPLHWMATLGDVRGAELLLDAGAHVNAADDAGNTPLHEAVSSRQHLVVRLLLSRGADADLRNNLGESARDIARRERYEPTLEAIGGAV